MKLWDKGHRLDEAAMSFTVGDDYLLDRKLVYWDCLASMSHARMLHKIGILSSDELSRLIAALKEIIDLDGKGSFAISPEQEDCHTAIEEYLTRKLGDLGKKIHTGRSRNDQVQAALRLYMKRELLMIRAAALKLAGSLVRFGTAHNAIFPGYTHMRKAMPSTIALWAGAFAESLMENLVAIDAAYRMIDACPLGSAAGYGVSLPIDREMMAKNLGFSHVQGNVINVQNSRGKLEYILLSSIMPVMIDLNKLASDMLLFSLEGLGFLKLPEEMCTGSSIMPQKKNPDVLELVRAKSKVVGSLCMQVQSLSMDLPSGYNRDFQLTKKPLIEGIEIARDALALMAEMIEHLEVDRENCLKGLSPEVFATDMAYDLVKKGMPFREAYRKTGNTLPDKMPEDYMRYITLKGHIGGPGNDGLGSIRESADRETRATEDMIRALDQLGKHL